MLRHFKSKPVLRWSDIAWTLLPLLFWLGEIYARPWVIRPHCADAPSHCTTESLPKLDRPAVGLEVIGSDALSFTTQGLSGILALAVPPLWNATLAVTGQVAPVAALAGAGVDLVLFTQTTAWNGLLTESARLVSQRPRPFVYADPARARDFSNYTAFYSGHTSFSAAATLYLILTLAGRAAPAWMLGIAGAIAYALVSLTGTFRILAGRHFPTDVLTGALAGALVALWVAYRHRLPLRQQPPG